MTTQNTTPTNGASSSTHMALKMATPTLNSGICRYQRTIGRHYIHRRFPWTTDLAATTYAVRTVHEHHGSSRRGPTILQGYDVAAAGPQRTHLLDTRILLTKRRDIWMSTKRNYFAASPPALSSSSSSSSSTNISVSSLDERFDNMTEKLIHQPLGSFTDATWTQAEYLLRECFESRNGTSQCWRILDRLAEEAALDDKTERKKPRLQTMQILNVVLKRWKEDTEHYYVPHGSNQGRIRPLYPSQVHANIERYRNVDLFRPDSASYTHVLGAIGHCQKHLPLEERSILALRCFEKWLHDYDEQEDRNSTLPKPDIVALGAVLYALAMTPQSKTGGSPTAGAEKAEELLQHPLIEKFWMLKLNDDKTILYSTMMLAWARAGNPSKTQEWMDRISGPDATAHTTLMQAWARHAVELKREKASIQEINRATEMVNETLDEMHRMHEEGQMMNPPGAKTYQVVFDMYFELAVESMKANNLEQSQIYARKARERLSTLGQQHRDNNDNYPAPTIFHYNAVLHAYSRTKQSHQAQQFFKEMMHNEFNVFPNVQSFNSLMTSTLSFQSSESPGDRAAAILKSMDDYGVVPDVFTFSLYANAWAIAASESTKRNGKLRDRRDLNNIVKRGDSMIQEWKEKYNVVPDAFVYTNLLKLYAKCQQPEKAQRLLDTWLEEYDRTKNFLLKPSAISFSPVLDAWAKLGQPEKCLGLVLRAKHDYGIAPNQFTVAIVLEAYARSTGPDDGENALQFFYQMRHNENVRPGMFAWTSVIKALSNHEQLEQAEELLRELLESKLREKLTAHPFRVILYGWSRSNRADALQKATGLLQWMQELHDSNRIPIPPDNHCFSSVLTTIARSRSRGGQLADDLLQVGMKRYKLKPNQATIHSVMNAWAEEGNSNKVLSYYRLLQTESQKNPRSTPDAITLRLLWKAIRAANDLSDDDKDDTMLYISKEFSELGIQLAKDMEEDLRRIQLK